MHKNSLKNLTYRISKGTIPWNKGRKGDMFSTRKDITDKKFGKLIAIKFHSRINRINGGFRYKWLFKCDCGKETIIDRDHVTQGHSTSCGCRLKEIRNNVKNIFKTHGQSNTRFWQIYRGILNRCEGTFKHPNYGGRGIKCLWKSFEEFRDDMYKSYLDHVQQFGEKNTTIDRINFNGNYCKENCRWATPKEQARNTRSNLIITLDNQSFCLAEWAEKTGIKEATIKSRIDVLGWPIERALTKFK